MFINESLLKPPPGTAKLKSQNLKIQAKLDNLKRSSQSGRNTKGNTSPKIEKNTNQKMKQQEPYDHDYWMKIYLNQGEKYSHIPQSEYNEQKFEEILGDELNQLLRKWQSISTYFQQKQKQLGQDNQSQSDKNALQQCCYLLFQQFTDQESAHQSLMNLLVKKMLQIDDYTLRLKNQIQSSKKQLKKLEKQYEKIRKEGQHLQKKQMQKEQMREEIQNTQIDITKAQKRLGKAKMQSILQKQQYVQIQAEEFRINKQLEQIKESQKRYYDLCQFHNKKNELQALKNKILQFNNSIQQKVTPHLSRKIQKMAQLRSNLAKISNKLQDIDLKIQQQGYIIGGLKQKYQFNQRDPQQTETTVNYYKKRYSEIYFPKNQSKSEWSDYKQYIDNLVANHKSAQKRIFTEFSEGKHRKKYPEKISNQGLANEYISNNQLSDSSLIIRSDYKINKRRTQQKYYLKKNIVQNKGQLKLPQLKIEQKKRDDHQLKDQVKQDLKRNKIKQNMSSDFELETILNNSSQVSGQIIEVQFHKQKNK